MEWFIAVVVIAVLGVAAVAAAGGLGEMSKEPVRDLYRQDLPDDRPLAAPDINRLRFGVTLRGYAMGQVDDVLDRLAGEIAERDSLIAELRAGATPTTLPAMPVFSAEVPDPDVRPPEVPDPEVRPPEVPDPECARRSPGSRCPPAGRTGSARDARAGHRASRGAIRRCGGGDPASQSQHVPADRA